MRLFLDSPSPVAVAVILPGTPDQVYNWTSAAFEAIPANGVFLPAHLKVPTRYGAATGTAAAVAWLDLPSACLIPGAAVVAVSVDATGVPVGGSGAELSVHAIDTGVRAIRLSLGPA